MSQTAEFSRRVVIEPLAHDRMSVEVEADSGERAGLARRLGLEELPLLRGAGRIERDRGLNEIRFDGWLEAEVVQSCVVSLTTIPGSVRVPVRRRYRVAEHGADEADSDPVAVATIELVDDDEDLELVYGGVVDLGEVMAEELSLALDPYPRSATTDRVADLDPGDLSPSVTVGEEAPRASPFAVLGKFEAKSTR